MEKPTVILHTIAETIENGERNVVAAPNIWFKEGKLFWPPDGVNQKRKKLAVPEDDWKSYDYTILKENIESLKEALKQEKRYSTFSNSESEKEALQKKFLQRKHPVNANNLIDANKLFDKVKKDFSQTEKVKQRIEILDDIIFDTVLPDNLFESAGDVHFSAQIGSIMMSTKVDTDSSNGKTIQNNDSCRTIVSGQYQGLNSLESELTILHNGQSEAEGNSMVSSQNERENQSKIWKNNQFKDSRSTIVSGSQYYGQNSFQYQSVPLRNELANSSANFCASNQTQSGELPNNDNTVANDSCKMYQNHQGQNYYGQQNHFNDQHNYDRQPNQLYGLQHFGGQPSFQVNHTLNSNYYPPHISNTNDKIFYRGIPPTINPYNTTNWCAKSSTVAIPPNVLTTNHNNKSPKRDIAFTVSQKCGSKRKENGDKNQQPFKRQRQTKNVDEKSTTKIAKSKKKEKENFCKTRAKNASLKTFGTKADNPNLLKNKVATFEKQKQIIKPKILIHSEKRKKNIQKVQANDNYSHNAAAGVPSQNVTIGCNNKDIPNPIPITDCTPQTANYLELIYKKMLDIERKLVALDNKINDIDNKIQNMEQQQVEIHEKLYSEEDNKLSEEDVETIDASMPIDKDVKLPELEFKLYSEPIYKKKLTLRAARLGGKKPQLMVRNIMKRYVTDVVLEKYTWTGTAAKGPFKKFTNFNKVVYLGVKTIFPRYTEGEYESYMVDYLRHAKSRQRPRTKKNLRSSESQYEVNNADIDENGIGVEDITDEDENEDGRTDAEDEDSENDEGDDSENDEEASEIEDSENEYDYEDEED